MSQAVAGSVSATPGTADGRELAAIISSLTRATVGVPLPQGIALVLSRAGLPRVTGWFQPDVSPGFSASVISMILDAITAHPSAPEPPASDTAAPRATWNRVRIANHAGPVGDLWLYEPRAFVTGSNATPDRSQASGAAPLLAHLSRWRQPPPSVDELMSLHRFACSLNSAADIDSTGATIVDVLKSALDARGVELALLDDERRLVNAACVGSIPLRDGTHVSRDHSSNDARWQTAAGWLFDVLPLISSSGQPIGAITCYWEDARSGEDVNLSLLNLMAEQAAAAIERACISMRTVALGWSAAGALADAVDARDAFTRHHALRVARYSRLIAEQLGMSVDEVKVIETAGLLHDIGKIGIPDRVLQASGALEEDDWDLIRRHPEFGASIVGGFSALAAVAPLIRHHHERFDGTGYPSGLNGKDIPLGARIISVVEAFDTLVTGRPYQSPWTVERTLLTLESLGGSQFDEHVVRLFCSGIRSGLIRVDVPPPAKTGDLDLHRWIGAEARAYGLLQRIGNEVGELIEITRFLKRLKEIIEAEFPDSVVDIFIRDREADQFIAVPDESRPHLEHNGAYVMTPDRGIVGWVVQHGKSQNVRDVLQDPRYVAPGDQAMRSELAVPMLLDDTCVGVLNLESPQASAYSRTDEKVLETIGSYVARALQVAELHSRVKQQTDIDSMTGLLNHRAFYRTLESEVDRAARVNDVVSVAIIDVDGFKSINDSMGHVWGDAVIRRLADLLGRSVRHGDAVARYGGDEFAIIMPGASREIMERRMQAIEQEIHHESEESPLPMISWGIATFPEDGGRSTELVAQADAAMYAVKQRLPG